MPHSLSIWLTKLVDVGQSHAPLAIAVKLESKPLKTQLENEGPGQGITTWPTCLHSTWVAPQRVNALQEHSLHPSFSIPQFSKSPRGYSGPRGHLMLKLAHPWGMKAELNMDELPISQDK